MGWLAQCHGFRSSFCTWAAERTGFPREADGLMVLTERFVAKLRQVDVLA
jgi:hypothetical protein